MKASFIRLRNRALNKFKTVKPKRSPVKKVNKTKKIRKTLRVFRINTVKKPVTEQKVQKSVSPNSSGKASPMPKIGKEVMASIIGHRRMFLRNRRLMHAVP